MSRKVALSQDCRLTLIRSSDSGEILDFFFLSFFYFRRAPIQLENHVFACPLMLFSGGFCDAAAVLFWHQRGREGMIDESDLREGTLSVDHLEEKSVSGSFF